MNLSWPPVEPMRDKFGRYAGTIHDGREKPWSMPKSRVTTIVGRLDDRYNLERWLWERIAEGLVANPENYKLLQEFWELGDSKAIKTFMEKMAEAGGSTIASERGTRYHQLVAMSIAGAKLPGDVTLEERRDIKAVLKLYEEHGITVVDLERIIINRELDYAGALDYRFGHADFADLIVGDLKTGSRLDFSYAGYRAQMSAYAHASHEVTDDGDIVDATPVDRDVGFIVHLVPGTATAELVGVDLHAGWRAFRLAHRVWTNSRGRPRPISWNETMLLKAQHSLDRDAARSQWVRERIDMLRTLTDTVDGLTATKYLRSIWPEGVALPSQCQGWTGDSLAAVLGALDVTETDFVAPFPRTDPALFA